MSCMPKFNTKSTFGSIKSLLICHCCNAGRQKKVNNNKSYIKRTVEFVFFMLTTAHEIAYMTVEINVIFGHAG